MNKITNKIYVIGDVIHFPTINKNDENKWNKKYTLDPSVLYSSWADELASYLNASIFYHVDADMSFGGVVYETKKVLEKSDDSFINYYILNLPSTKGRVHSLSATVDEVHTLNKALNDLHRSKDLLLVSKSLEKINQAKEKDKKFQSLVTQLINLITDNANYNNRFIITHYDRQKWNVYLQQLDRQNNGKNIFKDWDDVNNKLIESFSTNPYIRYLEQDFRRISKMGRIMSLEVEELKEYETYNPPKLFASGPTSNSLLGKYKQPLNPDEDNVSSIKSEDLDKRVHEIIGRKVISDLTTDKNFFKIQ